MASEKPTVDTSEDKSENHRLRSQQPAGHKKLSSVSQKSKREIANSHEWPAVPAEQSPLPSVWRQREARNPPWGMEAKGSPTS